MYLLSLVDCCCVLVRSITGGLLVCDSAERGCSLTADFGVSWRTPVVPWKPGSACKSCWPPTTDPDSIVSRKLSEPWTPSFVGVCLPPVYRSDSCSKAMPRCPSHLFRKTGSGWLSDESDTASVPKESRRENSTAHRFWHSACTQLESEARRPVRQECHGRRLTRMHAIEVAVIINRLVRDVPFLGTPQCIPSMLYRVSLQASGSRFCFGARTK